MKNVKKFKIALSIASIILIITSTILFFSLPFSQMHIVIIFISLTIISLIAFLVFYQIDLKQTERGKSKDIQNYIIESKQRHVNQEAIEERKTIQVPARPEIKYIQKIEEQDQSIKVERNLKEEVLNRYNQITMNEYVESTSAKKLYNDKKKQTIWILFLPLIPILLFIILFTIRFNIEDFNAVNTLTNTSLIFIIISGVMLIVCPIIRSAYLSKYKIIYLTAKKNDEVRYNEKIRFMERKRLETQYNNENNDVNILKTINGVGETVDD